MGYRRSFEDGVLSRGERRALRQWVEEIAPDRRERDLLRSALYAIARDGLAERPAAQVVDWLEAADKTLREEAAPDVCSRVYFSPGEACRKAIGAFVRSARQRLDICVFTITDDRLTDAVLDAFQRGVRVRVLSDDDKSEDRGSDIDRLSRAGIQVRVDRGPDHMHHKFALADGGSALTGSYNWTRSAGRGNHENLLLTDDPAVVTAYAQEFERLWAHLG